MRTLVAKEIRLLLPAFVGALALAIVPVWLVSYDPWDRSAWPALWPAYLYLFGSMLLALTSFGREIGLQTLSFMLAQPLERARIWWSKIAVLAVSVGVVFDAWLVSGNLRSILQPGLSPPLEELAAFGMLAIVFIAGGLWMTLLLRQTVAAFWLTLLIPTAVITAVKTIGGPDWMIFTALGVYAVAGFFLARRQFLHVQDTAWTGGMIVFAAGRAAAEGSALRERRPWAALLWKELQLQQFTLLAMGCLLLLHLGAVALRKAGEHTFSRTTLMTLEVFGGIWFFVPLLAGSQSVAEERKFGTMQAHLCLPVSRRAQWFLKLMVVMVVGGLLSWTLFSAVEHVADFSHGSYDFVEMPFVFLLLALAGFYGSTLTGGVVQALAAATLTLLGLLLGGVLPYLPLSFSRFQFCTGILPRFITWPALAVALLWLAYRNFGNVTENGRLWRRNALALAVTAFFSFILTVAVYHRSWEWFTPLEPSHGPARMSLEKPPLLHSYGGIGLAVVLPDGRLWAECLHDAQRSAFHDLPFGQKWTGLNDNKFAPGSNWVDGVANAHETVGIRADGTLWVSARPRRFRDGNGPPVVEPAAGLVQFGTDTNWLSAAPHPDSAMFLLKRDGTLWDWGDDSLNGNQTQPGLRGFQPQRLGHDSDWARLLGSKGWIYACAWKTDGSGWILHDSKALRGIMDIKRQDLPSGISLTRLPALDGSRWRSLVTSDNFAFAGVRDDGTLWYWNYFQGSERPWRKLSTKTVPTDRWKPVQVGKASDLAELAGTWQRMVARKTDGSLWAWEVDGIWFWEPIEALKWAPVRLSTHSDWTALGVVGPDILSLAADGNLWSWPNTSPVGIFGEDSELQLAASRKPSKIENIFDPK